MENLPRELVDAILQQCIASGPKNQVLALRLVCRLFDRMLKPYSCRTLGVDFSRLSKRSLRPPPRYDALQTIGHHCKSLYIDLMVLRDEMEVEYLRQVFWPMPTMQDFCKDMRTRYCLGDSTFSETDYYNMVETILVNCREVERLRLYLPFQLVGQHTDTATRMLANTFKALASRPEEDSAPLITLVLENVTDLAICNLWMNPIDVRNIMTVLGNVQNLVVTLRRQYDVQQVVTIFNSSLWHLLGHAGHLKTLCLISIEREDKPPRSCRQTHFWETPVEDWRAKSLPAPVIAFTNLQCLELKRVDILPESLLKAMRLFGATVEELYLNEVHLKTEQSTTWNSEATNVLWVGVPNRRPEQHCKWMAMAVRVMMPRLRVCRASFLGYDLYLREQMDAPIPEFDLVDPCRLGRSLSQRFVEVATGIQQPNTPSGDAVEYLCANGLLDHQVGCPMQTRTRALKVVEYDTNAYQTAVRNSTSSWHRSIDGIFHNCNSSTVDELHYIAETACKGMQEIHRRRMELDSEQDTLNESTVATAAPVMQGPTNAPGAGQL